MKINEIGYYRFLKDFIVYSEDHSKRFTFISGMIVRVVGHCANSTNTHINILIQGFRDFGHIYGNNLPVEKVDVKKVEPPKSMCIRYAEANRTERLNLLEKYPGCFSWSGITSVIEYGIKYVDLDKKYGYSLFGYFKDVEVLRFKSIIPSELHLFWEPIWLTDTASASGRYRLTFPNGKQDDYLVFKLDYLEIKE